VCAKRARIRLYNLLFRWFVGLNTDDAVWDATVFTKNHDDMGKVFLARVVEQAGERCDQRRAFTVWMARCWNIMG
jgi:hypothetical protein